MTDRLLTKHVCKIKFFLVLPIIFIRVRDRSISIVKIQDSLFQTLSLSTTDLTKKSGASSIGRSKNAIDYCVFGGEISRIEKEVFQTFKSMISDFKNAIDRLFKDDQYIVLPDLQVQLKNSESPVIEHTIIMLFLSKEGKVHENPEKIFLAYQADTAFSEMPISTVSVGKVVEEAIRFVKTLAGKELLVVQNIEGNAVPTGAEYGFVIKFSSFSYGIEGESMSKSQTMSVNPEQQEEVNVVSRPTIMYHVSGMTADCQYLNLLSLESADDGDVFKKLMIFISGVQFDAKQIKGDGARGMSQENQTVMRQNGNFENVFELQRVGTNPMFPSTNETNNSVIMSLLVSNAKNEMNYSLIAPTEDANGLISDLLPFENNTIISKIDVFVNRINMLLDADGNVLKAHDETELDAELLQETSLESIRQLQSGSPEIRAVVQNAVKKIFGDSGNFSDIELPGLSLEKSGFIRFDASRFASQITSNRDETVSTMKGFGNALVDRINYLMQPYASLYIDDKNILSMRAAQKDEGTSFQDKEMNKEQGSLEKRLNELKLLIERSGLLAEWFKQNGVTSPNDVVEMDGGR